MPYWKRWHCNSLINPGNFNNRQRSWGYASFCHCQVCCSAGKHTAVGTARGVVPVGLYQEQPQAEAIGAQAMGSFSCFSVIESANSGSSRTRPQAAPRPCFAPTCRASTVPVLRLVRPGLVADNFVLLGAGVPRHALPCGGVTGEGMLGYEASRDEAHANPESPSFCTGAPRRGDHREAA